MNLLQADSGFGPVRFYGKALHVGHDFFVSGNCPPSKAEVVLFFDSRGISAGGDTSLLRLLLRRLQDRAWLAVCRPLELTTWASFHNFLLLNALHPKKVVTNVGIVDFTPKKPALAQDMLDQANHGGAGNGRIRKLEDWTLSNGQREALCTVEYAERYLSGLREAVRAIPLLAIKTPVVSPDIAIDRPRPQSFFAQLPCTNRFIDQLSCETIDPGPFDRSRTYDAVHWTEEGNRRIYESVCKFL